MFIAQADFTANIEDRAVLDNKALHAKDDFLGYDGLIDVEIWKNEKHSTISYAIVSKWSEKKYFQAWLSRPSHIEEHKQMRKAEKENTSSVNIKKQIKQFELLDI
ncbi:MAG: hypothetical protein ABC378_11055 [Staphylococcus pseudoxylosus]|uniref:antibiotic biosynthesis monooxygenase family protein n=1 Tax=Staphylococcus pseudoxylosus TaxID=2282419 RepID=UPI002DBD30E5|nr:hypothetical protein [Staphylococcus pseudoxylosus]MEB6061255.1 hypothetical protein [Staphylococcus pseudoxylosus]MEB7754552.1 hypothetical protein [Staphylococcus pseudoxylosus]